MVEPLNPRRDPASVGPYRLLGRLGRGGFGTVYAARREDGPEDGLALENLVAVKVVHADLADQPDFRTRFAAEIAAISRVKCEFVPRLAEADATDDPPWLATNLIPGPSLDKVVRACGPLPEDAVWRLGAALAGTMACIHLANVVHRDFKPQNVLMASSGPWVIDFSLVHLGELAHRSSSRVAMATYKYAAPEQMRGLLEASFPADVYALAATLVFACTGHPPHDGNNPLEIVHHVLNGKPNLSGLPRRLYDLLEGCLRLHAEQRPSLKELRAEIERQAGGAHLASFAEVLPPQAVSMLEAARSEIAMLVGEITPLPVLRVNELDEREDEAVDEQAGPREDAARPLNGFRRDGAPREEPGPRRAGERAAVAWSRSLGSWICAPVAVHADVLVVTCLDGTVMALRAADGVPSERWGAPVSVGAAIHGGALVLGRGGTSGTAYVGAANGCVHAIDMSSGASRVVVEADAPIEGAPVAVGEWICALSADGQLHAIDPFTDQWAIVSRLPSGVTGSPSATSDGKVLAADTVGQVHAIDAGNGREAWVAHTDGLVLAAPVQVGPRVYLGGTDGVLRELRALDGVQQATDTLNAPVHVSPVAVGGRLYVATADGKVRAYDTMRPSGSPLRPLWKPRPLGAEISGLAVHDGRLFAAVGSRLVEVDAAWGLWDRELRPLDCLIGAPPVLAGPNCYLTGLGGLVECLVVAWPSA